MNPITEPEHPATYEHAIPPPIPPTTLDVDQLLEDHKLLNRLSQYPLVKAVCEQTSGIYTKAKQMSPQVVSNGLDKAHATIADVINKPAPVNLAPVEDFGCRQLDAFDNVLETPIGQRIQNFTVKIAQVGRGLVDKTPLRSLTSPVQSQAQNEEDSQSRSIDENPQDQDQNSSSGIISSTKEIYSEIREKGFASSMTEYLSQMLNQVLAKIESRLSLSSPPISSSGDIDNSKREEGDDQKDDLKLSDRALNVTAAVVHKANKKIEETAHDKISPELQQNITISFTKLRDTIFILLLSIFHFLISLPLIRDQRDKIDNLIESADEFSNKFKRAVKKFDSEDNKVKIEEEEDEIEEIEDDEDDVGVAPKVESAVDSSDEHEDDHKKEIDLDDDKADKNE